MGNDSRSGFLHITPLTLVVSGALWAVVVALATWNLAMTVELVRSLNGVPSQIADHEQRIRVLERAR